MFAVTVLMITLSACGRDSSPRSLIVGEWEAGELLVVIGDDGSMQYRRGNLIERGRWDMLGDYTLDLYYWCDGWFAYRHGLTLSWSNSSSVEGLEWHVTSQRLYMGGGAVYTRR